jgi:hypothetical protein
MFFPVNMPANDPTAQYHTRVQRLERALVRALDLLQTVVEKLDAKFGPAFLGEELAAFAQAGQDESLPAILDEIDTAVKADQFAAAARMVRAEFDIPWSEAHAAVAFWKSIPRERRLRWLQLARFLRQSDPAPSAT